MPEKKGATSPYATDVAGNRRKRGDHTITLLVSDLQWTPEDALETRMRLRTFEEDWNAPDMEAYDQL